MNPMNRYTKGICAGIVGLAITVPTVLYNKQCKINLDLKTEMQKQQQEHQLQSQEHDKEAQDLLKKVDAQLKEIDSLNKSNKELQSKNNELEDVRYIISNNLGGYKLKAGDIQLLQKVVEAEAGDEPFEGKVAVVNVIMNRMNSKKFPSTLKGVIYQANQFETVSNGAIYRVTPSKDSKEAVERALKGERVVGSDIVNFWATYLPQSNELWEHLTPATTIGQQHFSRGWDSGK